MSATGAIRKLGEVIDAHPKIAVAAVGALLALQLVEISETVRLLVSAMNSAHEAEVADGLRPCDFNGYTPDTGGM